jgi:hypothetical protein
MKKFLILLSVFYIGCESPVSNEIVEHEFRVFGIQKRVGLIHILMEKILRFL